MFPQLSKLWEIWTTDPLRSIGMLILPASIGLILYVWRQSGWEMHGSWWGLLPVALAFAPVVSAHRLEFYWAHGGVNLNFLPSVLPIFLYTGGVLLFFAGPRVLMKAWFPLLLLVCLQPVPEAFVRFLDLPMQSLSAQIARSFANLLGFPPSNKELLRLMFSPDFGMFIAPGCDGMRGAVTLGYGALILGYLKRLSLVRWFLYVVGALLLGHLFNLIRLCALVLYYRVAIGHPALQNFAKQADYLIGALLFCVAASLFWIVIRKESEPGAGTVRANSSAVRSAGDIGLFRWRAAVLTVFLLVGIVLAIRGMRMSSGYLGWAMSRGAINSTELNGRMPKQIGAYRLQRVWPEQMAGTLVLETGVFQNANSGEIQLGVWLAPNEHTIQASLRTHGETPRAKALAWFSTAAGRSIPFNTALYEDGVTDTLTGDTFCSPSSCQSETYKPQDGIHLAITRIVDRTPRGQRVIPIFFKLQIPHAEAGSEATYQALSAECAEFVSHVDFTQLSQSYQ